MNDSSRKVSLAYIAGYGRSGSTLLDTLLGNHPDIFGAGELCWLFHGISADEKCSCGATVRECSFWRSVLERVFRACPNLDCKTAADLTLRAQSFGWRSRDLDAYARLWRAVCRAIAEVSGKNVIVDSSKSCRPVAFRLALFARRLGIPVKAIHLVRDPRAVMWSIQRGSNRSLEKGLEGLPVGGKARGLLGWIAANLSVERVGVNTRMLDLLRVRYEDLACNPEATVSAIGDFLAIDPRPVLDGLSRQDTVVAGHGIRGNRMRRKSRIAMRFDVEWQARLSNADRYLSLLAWPLMKRYGYPMLIPSQAEEDRRGAKAA